MGGLGSLLGSLRSLLIGLEPSWGALGAFLGLSGAVLGRLEELKVMFFHWFLNIFRTSRFSIKMIILAHLEAFLGHLDAILGRTWAGLGRSWAILVALGSLLGRLGAVLGRSWAVLGRSWAVLGRSWAVLGRYVECACAWVSACFFR